MKDPRKIIDHLSPTDALSILRALADSDEGLARRIAEIAMAHLSGVDPEEVTAVLYYELDALEVEEVWDRAGSTRHGYIELGEAADQIIEKVLDLFVVRMGSGSDVAQPGVTYMSAIRTTNEAQRADTRRHKWNVRLEVMLRAREVMRGANPYRHYLAVP